MIIIGDSNKRTAFRNFSHYNCIKELVIDNKCEGGRRAKHLTFLYPEIAQYRKRFICLGNNDFNSTSDRKLLEYFTDLIEHLPYKHDILFLELLPKMDVKKHIDRNGYQFYFYDDENEEVQTMLDYMCCLMFHVRVVLMSVKECSS